MRKFISNYLRAITLSRPPNLIIGGIQNPYMLRWFFIPRNRFFNIYIHQFLRSDDDRALHDHPWINASFLIEGSYLEHRILQGGIHTVTERNAGDYAFRFTGKTAHRIELHKGPCLTLFITGFRYRQWGFHCEKSGWVHWTDFTNPNDAGDIGKGCNQ